MWIGFVCAISFMEAWLKFTAPGVTLAAGLAIGQVVFNTLNKVELLLAAIIAGSLLFDGQKLFGHGLFNFVLIVLLMQTAFILPLLSKRIDVYLNGDLPRPSSLHMVYVIMEASKVIALLFYGFKQLHKYEPNIINTR